MSFRAGTSNQWREPASIAALTFGGVYRDSLDWTATPLRSGSLVTFWAEVVGGALPSGVTLTLAIWLHDEESGIEIVYAPGETGVKHVLLDFGEHVAPGGDPVHVVATIDGGLPEDLAALRIRSAFVLRESPLLLVAAASGGSYGMPVPADGEVGQVGMSRLGSLDSVITAAIHLDGVDTGHTITLADGQARTTLKLDPEELLVTEGALLEILPEGLEDAPSDFTFRAWAVTR